MPRRRRTKRAANTRQTGHPYAAEVIVIDDDIPTPPPPPTPLIVIEGDDDDTVPAEVPVEASAMEETSTVEVPVDEAASAIEVPVETAPAAEALVVETPAENLVEECVICQELSRESAPELPGQLVVPAAERARLPPLPDRHDPKRLGRGRHSPTQTRRDDRSGKQHI